MKKIKKLFCFLFGHDMLQVCFHDNGRSKFWRFECQRCGHHHDSQWDYSI